MKSILRYYFLISFLLFSTISCQDSQDSYQHNITDFSLVPAVVDLKPLSGHFEISENTMLSIPDRSSGLQEIGRMIQQYFSKQYNINLSQTIPPGVENNIYIKLDNTIQDEEGYNLLVDKNQIVLNGKNLSGVFYAFQSLKQLVPLPQGQEESSLKRILRIPSVKIVDYPRFSYRGMHLDVCRHFFPVESVKKYIDLLAYHKLNRFHWHLTEDQGWRIEIKKYPKLTEVGAYRNETIIGHYNDQPQKFDGKRYGGFYTQEEIREVVKYAEERFITIIPEIEMPGHVQAALAAYPELACTTGPFEVATKWGVFEEVYCPTEQTFRFLEDVLTEVMDLFPGKYIHIGGDECPKRRWKESAFCQALMKKEGLKDVHELQSYFIKRIEGFLNEHARAIIGWDEILEGGLAPNATVMSWRGLEGGIEAARHGHNVIMTPTSHCYFDYYQSDHPDEPLAIGGFLPLQKVYNYEPVPNELNEEESKYILGTQGNLWTEYIPTIEKLEYMAFPRACAIAEVNWLPGPKKNYDDFTRRLNIHLKRLTNMGVNPANHLWDVKMKIISGSGEGVHVNLNNEIAGSTIHFSIDGSDPSNSHPEYKKPIAISGSMVLKAQSFENGEAMGRAVNEEFHWHKAVGKSIKFTSPPAEKYSAGGIGSVINGVPGSRKRYGDAEWLGFSGVDAEAVIDFEKVEKFQKVTLHFFNGKGQWIYLPNRVILSESEDGISYKELVTEEVSDSKSTFVIFPIILPETNARYLKIRVERFGLIPDGAQGAGNEAWLFLDEIVVE